jgi:SNF2 family DNA or RNA helicase
VKNQVVETTHRDVLICDESTWIKSHNTLRFKLLRGMLHLFSRRIILTGTPIPQGYIDLWSQMFVVNLGASLGKFITHYRNRYFIDVGYGFSDWRLVEGGDDLINAQIKPYVFRGDAPEVRAKLPEITYATREIDLPAPAMQLYRRLEAEFHAELGEHTFLSPTAAALSQKLRMVANGTALADNPNDPAPDAARNRAQVHIHSEKINALREIVNELNGNPLLVFYEFVADRERVCFEFDAPYIGGGVSAAEAAKLVKEFNAGKHPVLVVHPQSGGFGLNLQEACHNVCWFGPTWSAGSWDQGNARVFRQGQTRPVVVHSIVARGTKDAAVAEVLAGKLRTQAALLDAVRG